MSTLEQAITEDGLRPLPEEAEALLRQVGAPPRLGAHLRAVHHVAVEIVDWVGREVDVDGPAVLFGAATHDIGKVRFPGELSGPGAQHEPAGQQLLVELGVDPHRARFAALHGARRRRSATPNETGPNAVAPGKAGTEPGIEDGTGTAADQAASAGRRTWLEELLVTLADTVWKGRRDAGLEEQVAQLIAEARNEPVWAVFMRLDDELTRIADGADARLDFQSRFPTA